MGFALQDENDAKSKKGEEECDTDCGQQSQSAASPLLLPYNDAPTHLKFNPYIRNGYRGYLTPKMCLER
jgi:hypothetical protein